MQWVSVLNQKKNELYQDSSKLWDETYEVRSLGLVSASLSPSYDVPESFIAAAGNGDKVGAYVITSDSQRINLELVKPQEAISTIRQAYIVGRGSSRTLKLTGTISATDQLVGGTLYLPGYYMPDDVAEDDDELPLPDPYWGVMATAAELAFNDLTYEDKAAEINAKANSLYRTMVMNNQRGTYGKPRSVAYNVKKLGMSNHAV